MCNIGKRKTGSLQGTVRCSGQCGPALANALVAIANIHSTCAVQICPALAGCLSRHLVDDSALRRSKLLL